MFLKLIIIVAIGVLVSGCAATGSKSSTTTTNSVPSSAVSGPRTIILDGAEIKEYEDSEFISWICRDFPRGKKTLFEVGRWSIKVPEEYEQYSEEDLQKIFDEGDLTDEEKGKLTESFNELLKSFTDFLGMQGFILFDGTNVGERTMYYREGLNQRWVWGELEDREASRYSFIIKPDGTGLFYDFITAIDGTKERADDVYKCTRVN